jgi:lipoyl(octanoyl) transferase
MNKKVAIQDLGLKDYKETWDYQEQKNISLKDEKTYPSPKG